MILWNFPNDSAYFPTVTSVLHFIESCWTCFTGEYNSDGSPVMESLGFAYCLPCKQGAISYVMKYMKKQYIPPKGKNPLFFLTSRKNGGLGAEYARKFLEHYRSHPDDTKMTATDPFTGYTQTMSTLVGQKLQRQVLRTSKLAVRVTSENYHKTVKNLWSRTKILKCFLS